MKIANPSWLVVSVDALNGSVQTEQRERTRGGRGKEHADNPNIKLQHQVDVMTE